MNKILNVLIIVLIIAISYRFFTNFNRSKDYMITAERVQEKLDNNEEFILLDVRTKEEYAQGRIPGSILLPLDQLEKNAENVLKDKDEEIIIYCRSGNRSNTARNILTNMGYTRVYDLGGILDWPYGIEK